MKKIVFFIALITIGFSSCKNDNVNTTITTGAQVDQVQLAIDDTAIANYLSVNKLTAKKDSASGLYYQVVSTGSGLAPTVNSTVTVTYTGSLLNGVVFDQETNVSFTLSKLIKGWQIGLPFIKNGGNIILYVPSGLAYGTFSNSTIPANSILIFNINLLNIQ